MTHTEMMTIIPRLNLSRFNVELNGIEFLSGSEVGRLFKRFSTACYLSHNTDINLIVDDFLSDFLLFEKSARLKYSRMLAALSATYRVGERETITVTEYGKKIETDKRGSDTNTQGGTTRTAQSGTTAMSQGGTTRITESGTTAIAQGGTTATAQSGTDQDSTGAISNSDYRATIDVPIGVDSTPTDRTDTSAQSNSTTYGRTDTTTHGRTDTTTHGKIDTTTHGKTDTTTHGRTDTTTHGKTETKSYNSDIDITASGEDTVTKTEYTDRPDEIVRGFFDTFPDIGDLRLAFITEFIAQVTV